MYYLSPSQLVSDSHYSFAVGLVRALEVKLFNQQTVNRLLDAKDIPTLKRELGETEYHDLLSSGRDFETELQRGLKRTYELITAIAPEPDLIILLRLKYDFHNIKALYKARMLGESAEAALSDLGLIDKNLLLQITEDDNYEQLPSGLNRPVIEAVTKLGSSPTGSSVDMAFDGVMYDFLYHKAEKAESLFLKILFQQQIDLINLKSWLRIKKREGNKKILLAALLDHGLIEKGRWLDLYELAVADLPAKLAHTPYARLISEGISRYQQQGSLSVLQRLIDSYMLGYMESARLICMGPEPLIAYLWAKENEAKVLRTVLVGKLNDLPLAVIKERLPVYA